MNCYVWVIIKIISTWRSFSRSWRTTDTCCTCWTTTIRGIYCTLKRATLPMNLWMNLLFRVKKTVHFRKKKKFYNQGKIIWNFHLFIFHKLYRTNLKFYSFTYYCFSVMRFVKVFLLYCLSLKHDFIVVIVVVVFFLLVLLVVKFLCDKS